MDCYQLNHNFLGEVSCGCCSEGIIIAAIPNSVVYFQDTTKLLPWFTNTDLNIIHISMNSCFVAILTRNRMLFLFPIYTLAGDQFLPA